MYRLSIVFFIFLLTSCAENRQPVDLTGEEWQNDYAEGFLITDLGDDMYRLTLYDMVSDSGLVGDFLLIPRGLDVESQLPVINFPIKNAACLSTTHVSMMQKAGALDKVKGSAFANLIMNPSAMDLVKSGHILDLSGSEELDFEAVISLAPDVFFTYPFGDSDYGKYDEIGIPCLPVSEYSETHPLGRAEWIKVMGLLSGTIDVAQENFNEIRSHYLETSNLVANMVSHQTDKKRPVVFTGSHSSGMWFAPSGDSFIARFLADAGAVYLFEDDKSGQNVELQFEELFDLAYDADFWGKVIYEPGELTLKQIRANDERYAELKSFREKQIFYCNTAESDYFGDGVVEPHVILEDLVSIFYPSLSSDTSFVYFRPVTR